MWNVLYAAQSIQGLREGNQDNFLVDGQIRSLKDPNFFVSGEADSETQLYVVCDGMGGESSGDEASLMAVQYLQNVSMAYSDNEIEKTLQSINDYIWNYANSRQIQMGTTFAGVFIQEKCIQAVNLGDSRIYRIRNGIVTQMSKDHTEFQILIDAGLLKKDNFENSSIHHHLIQYLGMPSDEIAISPHMTISLSKSGDQYLICSDGLYSCISDRQILAFTVNQDLESACKNLVCKAYQQGSKDNITAVLIRLETGDKSVADCDESLKTSTTLIPLR